VNPRHGGKIKKKRFKGGEILGNLRDRGLPRRIFAVKGRRGEAQIRPSLKRKGLGQEKERLCPKKGLDEKERRGDIPYSPLPWKKLRGLSAKKGGAILSYYLEKGQIPFQRKKRKQSGKEGATYFALLREGRERTSPLLRPQTLSN